MLRRASARTRATSSENANGLRPPAHRLEEVLSAAPALARRNRAVIQLPNEPSGTELV